MGAREGRAIFIRTDLTEVADVRNMMDATMQTFGRLDVLVNNAGYHISKNVEVTTEEKWDFIINTNRRSPFLCSKYAIPQQT